MDEAEKRPMGGQVSPPSGLIANYAEEPLETTFHGRKITIEPLGGGYLVEVGCERMAFIHLSQALVWVKGYLDNPQKYESHWIKTHEILGYPD